MELGRCVTRDFGNVGCSENVIGQLDRVCSGRSRCRVSVSDPALVRTSPCPKDFSSYLWATYSCVKLVERYSSEQCRRLGHILLRQSSGFISNSDDVTWRPPCAYVIEVPLGQRINVTLLDFAYWPRNQSAAHCEELAMIKEGLTGSNVIVCRDGQREKVVLLSRSNRLEVVLLAASPASRFLLHYEAFGCARIRDPPGASVMYSHQSALVVCRHTKTSSLLKCERTKWVGTLQECSRSKGEAS
ncbi:hypothetical protein LSAT2_016294 [Lamellibrachia satsuma]|nr:hypothetical protein LSAT2_016294 [Lamellibrachia satsuma]